MKPFEISSNDTENLRDAFNRRISKVFVPEEEDLENLNKRIIESEIHNTDLLVISNIDELEKNSEKWECSEIPSEASFITLNRLILELVGESELTPSFEGYSLSESIEVLEKHAFVQCTKLNLSNVIACLNNGGDIIAYFSDELWRSFFDEYFDSALEILGMRAVRITDIDDGIITCDDYSRKNGRGVKIDAETFEWLAENGIMLEVYK